MKTRTLIHLLLSIVLFVSCNDKKENTEDEEVLPLVFTQSPVDTANINAVTPLGNINPPGHTFPTNHIYFYMNGINLVNVYSIAGGEIITVQYHDGSDDNSIVVEFSGTSKYYYDHVSNIPAYIEVGYQIEAGEFIGTSNPLVAALDLGVIDFEVTRSYIIPERYLENFLNCGNPYLYFTDSVRNILYMKNERTSEPRGGKIDYDIDGTLAGNWFLKGTPVHILNATHEYMETHLTFVYDMWDPEKIIIATGGTLELSPFVSSVVDNTPDPQNITPASGIIKYEFDSWGVDGTMLVQMLDNREIKVEVFPDLTGNEVENFTSNAKNYTR
ncbi:MAG: hypothetical protein JXJ22_04275 [Bacteroidales bacterium]|nr:hypothetical protein [Bacteroidales bacterium]